MFLYIVISPFIICYGELNINLLYLELPFLLILSTLLYFPIASRKVDIKNIICSIIVVVGLYIFFDIFYSYLDKTPRISDSSDFSSLFGFSWDIGIAIILYTILIISPIIFLIKRFKKNVSKIILLKIIFVKFIFVFFLIVLFNSNIFFQYQKTVFAGVQDFDLHVGRFSSILFYNSQELFVKRKVHSYENNENQVDVNKILFNDKINTKRNVYFILLESFIDPRLIEDVEFDKSPLYEGILPFLKDGEFSYSISPVYGSGTPQAEFNLLMGVPSPKHVYMSVFKIMNGHPMSGFVNSLNENGYNIFATVATGSDFYNSRLAHKSVGLNKVFYLLEEEDFEKNEKDKLVFDGDLFEYSYDKLKEMQSPFFFYNLGMYGHFPHKRNYEDRPDLINATSEIESVQKVAQKIANQFYYRTEALAEYLNKIIENDPNSVILVISDHIPPIMKAGAKYKYEDIKKNIALLIVDGEAVHFDERDHYKISWLIWDILTENGNAGERDVDKTITEQIYYKVLSESVGE